MFISSEFWLPGAESKRIILLHGLGHGDSALTRRRQGLAGERGGSGRRNLLEQGVEFTHDIASICLAPRQVRQLNRNAHIQEG